MQKDVHTTKEIRDYDVVDRATTDVTREDTVVSTIYDETIIDDRKTIIDDRTTIIDDRKTVRDDKTTETVYIDETVYTDETKPRHGGPRKPEKVVHKEQCICEICTCG